MVQRVIERGHECPFRGRSCHPHTDAGNSRTYALWSGAELAPSANMDDQTKGDVCPSLKNARRHPVFLPLEASTGSPGLPFTVSGSGTRAYTVFALYILAGDANPPKSPYGQT
jgi:hypothetical protein